MSDISLPAFADRQPSYSSETGASVRKMESRFDFVTIANAVRVAGYVAFMLEYVALYDFGLSREAVRKPATADPTQDVLCSKGSPSSAELHIGPAFRHLATARGRNHVRNVREHGGDFCDCAMTWCHKCRNAPKRINGQIAWVQLPLALNTHGFAGQTAVLKRNMRRKGARTSFIVAVSMRSTDRVGPGRSWRHYRSLVSTRRWCHGMAAYGG
jgi:hypothetical protein